MEITLKIKNTENLQNFSEIDHKNIEKIMLALVSSGGLTGVRGGQTIIHFDASGKFMGVQLSYWPWRLKDYER